MSQDETLDLPREAIIADPATILLREACHKDYIAKRITTREALWRIEGYKLWSLPGETDAMDGGWRKFVHYLLAKSVSVFPPEERREAPGTAFISHPGNPSETSPSPVQPSYMAEISAYPAGGER